tara:strand:+ start:1272 stop:1556 length:285 start_codon:yes stop_codon:yes gene_type:complete
MRYCNHQIETHQFLTYDGQGSSACLFAALTTDASGLYAVYVAIVERDLVDECLGAVTVDDIEDLGLRVGHMGQKQSYAQAKRFFPLLSADDYRR